jgi:hypothetical protein
MVSADGSTILRVLPIDLATKNPARPAGCGPLLPSLDLAQSQLLPAWRQDAADNVVDSDHKYPFHGVLAKSSALDCQSRLSGDAFDIAMTTRNAVTRHALEDG